MTAVDTKQVYRVHIRRDTNSVSVLPLGMECLESDLEGDYTWDQLPTWMTDQLTVLSIMPNPPPPIDVDRVGKRISPDVFWVYRHEGSPWQ